MSRTLLVLGRIKPLLVILGWGTSLASVTLWAIFSGLLLPRVHGGLLPTVQSLGPWGPAFYYLGFLGICILASIVLVNPATALVSYVLSYGLAGILIYVALALPAFLGIYQPTEILVRASINFTFTALFPFSLLAGFVGTVVGMFLAEYLS